MTFQAILAGKLNFNQKFLAALAQPLVNYTVNPNGETLVLNSDFPSMQQVFAQTTPASKKVA